MLSLVHQQVLGESARGADGEGTFEHIAPSSVMDCIYFQERGVDYDGGQMPMFQQDPEKGIRVDFPAEVMEQQSGQAITAMTTT